MTFAEKSLWATTASVSTVFVAYFAMAAPVRDGSNVRPDQVAWFVLAVVALALIQAVAHAVLAVVDRRTGTDERGRLIALKGARNGAYALATAVFAALCAALGTTGNAVFMHVLLGGWVVAQLVDSGSQIILYRRQA